MMMNASQCKAARMLLDWNQRQLARAANVSIKTISNFENGKARTNRATIVAIEQALGQAGVELIHQQDMKIQGVLLHRQVEPTE